MKKTENSLILDQKIHQTTFFSHKVAFVWAQRDTKGVRSTYSEPRKLTESRVRGTQKAMHLEKWGSGLLTACKRSANYHPLTVPSRSPRQALTGLPPLRKAPTVLPQTA